MIANLTPANGATQRSASSRDELSACDRLPSTVRRCLNHCRFNFSAVRALEVWRDLSVGPEDYHDRVAWMLAGFEAAERTMLDAVERARRARGGLA